MLSTSDFVARYPAFSEVSAALIGSKITEAAASVHEETWGALYDEAVGLLAAHKLSLEPTGQNARLKSDMAATTYGRRFSELREQVTFALGRVY